MKRLFYINLIMLLGIQAYGQDTTRKVWVSGAARGVLYGDDYSLQNSTDSVTPAKLNSGHTMVDLKANVKPNSQTYINATVRVRNDYGGFWGAGVTFDVRQLYVKGVVANTVRYQLGDINYKLTPYTFYNNDESAMSIPGAFGVYKEMLHYDMFYQDDNSWRQQGAAADFALEFSNVVEELQFNFFATRQNPTDFGFTSERIFYGGNISLLQSKYFDAGVNFTNMMDLLGTSDDTTSLHMPVQSLTAALHLDEEDWNLDLKAELGNSRVYVDKDTSFNEHEDYFYDFGAAFVYKPYELFVDLSYRDVGPKFRSPGAQSLRLNYASNPFAFGRIGRNQDVRSLALIDLLRDASIYNYRLSSNLQTYLPRYGNAQPYGVATPNRKGFTLALGQNNYKGLYDVKATYQSLSEIVGQGTDALRAYNTLRLNATLHVASMIGSYNKAIDLEFAYWNENTKRDGEEAFENVDFTNTSYSLGVEIETINKLKLIYGLMNVESSGFEYLSLRNNSNEIVDFLEYKSNITENISAVGLKYEFSATSSLQFNWQVSQCANADDNSLDYRFDQFALMYNLKF